MNSYSKELLVKMLLSKFKDNGINPRFIHDQMDHWHIILKLSIGLELSNESLKMFSIQGAMHAEWKDPQNHIDEIVEMALDWTGAALVSHPENTILDGM